MDTPEISRLLRMKGNCRLGVKDDMAERIQRYPYKANTPGLELTFLETREDRWPEYYALLSYRKTGHDWEDTVGLLDSVSLWLNDFEDCDEIGIQEMETSLGGYNYILIYIIGK